jgi:hypothetical protein
VHTTPPSAEARIRVVLATTVRPSFISRTLFSAALAASVAVAGGCSESRPVIAEQVRAAHLAAQLRAEFAHANEAANRAVLADTEDASQLAASDARQAIAATDQALSELTPILQSLNYADERKAADSFAQKFAELKRLDAEILSLAVENTNLKAQRLMWTDGKAAADDCAAALQAAMNGVPLNNPSWGFAAAAQIALLRIQVIQPRHIAEADDAQMTAMEKDMADQERNARSAFAALRARSSRANAPRVDAAAAAFDRFMAVNAESVQLSRRNSNVRSLALTLGRKRLLAAECAEELRALEERLGQHQFRATR